LHKLRTPFRREVGAKAFFDQAPFSDKVSFDKAFLKALLAAFQTSHCLIAY
jgi:hypothetical protein